mgnify:CR=1 FL=1
MAAVGMRVAPEELVSTCKHVVSAHQLKGAPAGLVSPLPVDPFSGRCHRPTALRRTVLCFIPANLLKIVHLQGCKLVSCSCRTSGNVEHARQSCHCATVLSAHDDCHRLDACHVNADTS